MDAVELLQTADDLTRRLHPGERAGEDDLVGAVGLSGHHGDDADGLEDHVDDPHGQVGVGGVIGDLAEIGGGGKPMILVFNKIDAYSYVEKAPDDLTPRTKENLTLEELMKTWMAKMEDNCLFISARERINIDELKNVVYQRVKELHVQKYPYNDFLYQTYEEEEEE